MISTGDLLSDSTEGDSLLENDSSLIPSFQKIEAAPPESTDQMNAVNTTTLLVPNVVNTAACDQSFSRCNKSAVTDQFNKETTSLIDDNQDYINYLKSGTYFNDSNKSDLSTLLARVHLSSFPWKKIDKSPSPRIRCKYEDTYFSALVDCGAEINVMDKDFAQSLNIGITYSIESAQAANKIPLDVYGQTVQPISIECPTDSGTIMLHLGIMLIISNLGTPCLLGEPAKEKNNIICLPRQKIVLLANGKDVAQVPYDIQKPKYSVLRAVSSYLVNPGERFECPLPEHLKLDDFVTITPRNDCSKWLNPIQSQR